MVKNEKITIEMLKAKPYVLCVWKVVDDESGEMEENYQAFATFMELIEQVKTYMHSIDKEYCYTVETFKNVMYDLQNDCVDFKQSEAGLSDNIEWWQVAKFEMLPTDKQTFKEYRYLWNNEQTRQKAERRRAMDIMRENK